MRMQRYWSFFIILKIIFTQYKLTEYDRPYTVQSVAETDNIQEFIAWLWKYVKQL